MAPKDIFEKPFDEGTLIKLEIFEKYFEGWLPTFIHLSDQSNKTIQIFDLFAGKGYDINGQEGSPVRILKVINKFRKLLINKHKKINVYLNDYDQVKYNELSQNIKNKIKELDLTPLVELKITNSTFEDCINHYDKELLNGYNLLFIDQNGFKEVNEKIFKRLINLDYTEFIFFISSSYLHRFADTPEAQGIHQKFDLGKIKKADRKKVHNVICEEYHKYVPPNISNYSLIPFSIMKSDNNNVYGLIFVSKNIRGADKFLNIVWKKNQINGKANFDIDDDLTKKQLDLFNGKIPTKIEKFQYDLRQKILKGEIKNNKDAYLYTINQGHIHTHADIEIRKMKEENLIDYNSKTPLVNYVQVFTNNRIIEYKILYKNNNETN
jgi:three-Cys-motif partner protein